MIKIIITTLILLTFPIFSHADGGVLEDISINTNTSLDIGVNDISTSLNSIDRVANTQITNISATSTVEAEVENDGFFRRVINWFKGLFN
jgi:uncharacterized protein related to proFAR isomerase